ncbi:MAG: DNA translocase FtsK 4TM domain-containing protein [Desulfobacterales bacterium]|nr:DNA translocase FtsK 4TM domain-containing protein [Desulfobacterales bacterium]
MHKEVWGIFLFFLVVFSLISLLSYSPTDPSIHNATSSDHIHNRFGFLGAHLAGILVGLFGLGAFWIPILILLFSMHFFHDYASKAIISTIIGGMILIITTGSLLAFRKNDYLIFGTVFSSGGLIGISLKSLLIKYTNLTGSVIILILIWINGFILSTGFSILIFIQRLWRLTQAFADRIKILIGLWKERQAKSANRRKIKKESIIKEKKQDLKINKAQTNPKKAVPASNQEIFDFMPKENGFQMPSVNFLEDPDLMPSSVDEDHLKMQSKLLEKKLNDFGVNGKVVTVTPGPVITTFEYEPAAGVKINKIVNLTDDLALALRAISIRIVAPIPGKAVIGIEIPKVKRQMVRFKEVVVSEVFEKSKSKMTICLGKDIVGNPVVADLDKMPHLLIAGATGTGKSVALNTMICSLLYKSNPDDVKLIMVDPKRIELSMYDGIPHLITPVVTDVKKATNALFWAVREMERRYEKLSEQKARNINQYNEKLSKRKRDDTEDNVGPEKLPYIVIIIDELADLMMVASRDVEVALTRLAQMARAAGIHLILATQRPSVDVLTGIIKANFPTRLTFQVSSKTDSRTIIDMNGAENLLGSGDMLFLPPGTARLKRIHGAYLSETEISKITDFLKNQQTPDYDKTVTKAPVEEKVSTEDREYDERYDDAVALVTKTRQASISMIQRHLRIGYNRAARIIEIMEKEGIVGPSDGAKPREVLVPGYDNMP